jgi:hypothetical protein
MNLMDLLKWQLSDGVINGMSDQLNIGDSQKTGSAAQAALSVLMGALSKNSTSSESALSGLSGALDRDHDGSILDDVMGLVTGQTNMGTNKTLNGAGILGHLLGGKQDNAVNMLMKMTGLDTNQSAGLLVKLAPMVLGVLGRYKKQNHLDQNGLSDFLRTSQQEYVKEAPERSIFEKFLDQDGDGSVMDEVAEMGLKVLGNLFK